MFTLTVSSLAGRQSYKFNTLPEALAKIHEVLPAAHADDVRTAVRLQGHWLGGNGKVTLRLEG